MNKEFIPYEQSLVLKELGFDEPCFGYHINESKELILTSEKDINYLTGTSSKTFILAPTFSQAFRWFREKYNLMFQIFYLRNGNYGVIIHRTTPEYMDLVDQIEPSSGCVGEVVDCYSYEEAELACLKKLIEIVKTK